ncbi:hypothetical protein BDA99DRAFT_523076 [Phascolomyces articulosus]|uniref:Uncharacterized protein n=1 Tax=Phascolomyces articulosus TaxID=60185 RepID=A0AAD5K1U8_9FUNG|nr:hypothetical protein BDA99DRAFT_523076 [Phascolomyces articulosus]
MPSIATTTSAVLVLGYFAASAAAANCNPSYNVAAGPECITKCRQEAGLAMDKSYTLDASSDKFISSLALECEKGTPSYTSFMTQSGMCMMKCSESDQADYGSREHADACTWYTAHKSDTCADASGSASTPAASSSGGSSNPDASSSASSDSAQQSTDESAANSLKFGSLLVTVAAAGAAALLF